MGTIGWYQVTIVSEARLVKSLEENLKIVVALETYGEVPISLTAEKLKYELVDENTTSVILPGYGEIAFLKIRRPRRFDPINFKLVEIRKDNFNNFDLIFHVTITTDEAPPKEPNKTSQHCHMVGKIIGYALEDRPILLSKLRPGDPIIVTRDPSIGFMVMDNNRQILGELDFIEGRDLFLQLNEKRISYTCLFVPERLVLISSIIAPNPRFLKDYYYDRFSCYDI